MDEMLLRSFVVLVDELHFGRTAARLHVAQPALSRAIRRLEREVGAELFDRTTRAVELTRAGRALIEPATAALASFERAQRAVSDAASGRAGHVRIGYAGPSSSMQVAALVRDVRSQEPGIGLTLRSMTYGELSVQQVRDGVLDLAITRWRIPGAELRSRVVATERPVFVVPAGHPLASRSLIRASDLRDEPLVVLSRTGGSSLRTQVADLCLAEGFQPKVGQVAPDTWTAVALVAAGVGLHLTFDSAAENARAHGAMIVPLDGGRPVQSRLIWRTEVTSPALEHVLRIAETTLPTPSDAVGSPALPTADDTWAPDRPSGGEKADAEGQRAGCE